MLWWRIDGGWISHLNCTTCATLATILHCEDGAFGAAEQLAACALGERNVVCGAEGVLRGFLIGK
jgi:hypothetical protein